jgi:hypothetical protein
VGGGDLLSEAVSYQAFVGDVLSGQHSSVRRRLVAIGLHFHATCRTAEERGQRKR